MNETIIDRTYVCLKLIDMLYKKGLINEATYFHVKRTYQNKMCIRDSSLSFRAQREIWARLFLKG